jgi:hypothetical protein
MPSRHNEPEIGAAASKPLTDREEDRWAIAIVHQYRPC